MTPIIQGIKLLQTYKNKMQSMKEVLTVSYCHHVCGLLVLSQCKSLSNFTTWINRESLKQMFSNHEWKNDTADKNTINSQGITAELIQPIFQWQKVCPF